MLKLVIQKKKVASGKTTFIVIDPFCTAILFVLTLAFDRAILNEDVAFSTLVFLRKMQYSSF